MRRLVREVIRLRKAHGYTSKGMAEAAGVHESHWCNVESGRRMPSLGLLNAAAAPFGGSVEVVYDHHRPFLDLDPAEAYELMRLAQHYRARHPEPSEVLVTLAAKLDKWMRVRRPVGRPRKMEAAA